MVNSCTENKGTAAKVSKAPSSDICTPVAKRTRNASGALELKTAIHNTSAAATVVACISQ